MCIRDFDFALEFELATKNFWDRLRRRQSRDDVGRAVKLEIYRSHFLYHCVLCLTATGQSKIDSVQPRAEGGTLIQRSKILVLPLDWTHLQLSCSPTATPRFGARALMQFVGSVASAQFLHFSITSWLGFAARQRRPADPSVLA